GDASDPRDTGALSRVLPKGNYYFASKASNMHLACLGFLLGAYKFDKYKNTKLSAAKLVLPSEVNKAALVREAEATMLVRNLINTPTNDLGPDELEGAVKTIAKNYKASVQVTKGEALLKKNFPMIHAVGRASDKAPRLIDLKWGNKNHKKITLVGKGVCFDTGGLNIKPGNSMLLMKKDMGGAANVLGLAYLIMAAKLPVRLRVLIPAVENNISANAYRPGDILSSRKGLSVEIGNTDAEGRLVLADALTFASEEKPELIIDMATLTGAARVALGPDLPPFFTDNAKLATQINEAANAQTDPLWQLPLWAAYKPMLNSPIADTNHISSGGFAGCITAALFLQKFVDPKITWAHFDVFGWAPTTKPWVQVGGEAQGIRALFDVLANNYSK
ncbi:MAG: M17 family metallopeptidase, partial [Nitratireductor sp.]